MDFLDELRSFSARVSKLKESISTEEATKTSIVLPFFQLLGYDIFNPVEFTPEFTADTGTKKGEKVDYAILQNGDPIMIVEVKPVTAELNTKHINQLFRYFSVTKAKFGILTNGIIYKFYSDLEEMNKMDFTPFLEVNLFDLKNDTVNELKKFKKECFNTKDILSSASELKYTSLLKSAIAEQFNDPSEQFVRALIKNIYTGLKTQSVIDKFKELTLVALNEYISDLLNDKIKTVITAAPSENNNIQVSNKEPDFLPEEIETLDYVKNMLNTENVSYKKTTRYAYMHISDSQHKWIFRTEARKENMLFVLHKFNDTDYETEYFFDDVTLLSEIRELIIDTYEKCKEM